MIIDTNLYWETNFSKPGFFHCSTSFYWLTRARGRILVGRLFGHFFVTKMFSQAPMDLYLVECLFQWIWYNENQKISTGIGWYVVIMNVCSLKKHRYFRVFTCNISVNDLVAVLITIFRNTHHVGDHHHQQNWKHLVLCVTKWKTISHSIH